MITNREFFPHRLLSFVCKSYPVSLVCVEFRRLTYVLTDLYKIQDYRKIVHRLLVLPALAAVIIYALPIHYFQNGNVIYTYGPEYRRHLCLRRCDDEPDRGVHHPVPAEETSAP